MRGYFFIFILAVNGIIDDLCFGLYDLVGEAFSLFEFVGVPGLILGGVWVMGGLPVLSWKVSLQGNRTSNRTCLISTVILIMCFYDILNILCNNNLKSTLAAPRTGSKSSGEWGKGERGSGEKGKRKDLFLLALLK